MDNNLRTSTDTYSKSKRIASNTLLLFVRMFILTVINLYAVRLVLKGLGEQDYGIFNTVAGVVTTTTFLSGVLAVSIQRFFSISLGQQDAPQLNRIFSASINISLVLSAAVFLLFETVGLWFVHTQLTIPADRMAATLWTFQFSLAAFLCTILQIPYTAAIFAHEDMGLYALISTVECLLRLAAAYLTGKVLADNLVFYSSGLFVASLLILLFYAGIARSRYTECRYRHVKAPQLYKELLSFSGWALFGSVANVGLIQGNTILLNIFFGPLVNVAFGIALQINNALNTLCNSMVLAFRPAMIKAYAETRLGYLNQLFSVSNKFILYLLAAVALPLIAEMESILRLWLGNTTAEMVLFARLMIVYIVCMAMNNPISIIMHASGRIMEYNLPVESITLLCLPVSWLLFRLGCPAYSVFFSMIGVCLVAHVVRLLCLRRYYEPFSIRQYVTTLVLPATAIISVSALFTGLLHTHIGTPLYRFLAVATLPPALLLLLTYLLGISRQEKQVFHNIVRSYLPHP